MQLFLEKLHIHQAKIKSAQKYLQKLRISAIISLSKTKDHKTSLNSKTQYERGVNKIAL